MKDSWKDWPKGYWSHSRFSALRSCPKKHHLRYREHVYVKGPKPDAMQIGSYCHDVFEFVGRECLAGSTDDLDAIYAEAEKLARAELRNPGLMPVCSLLIQAHRGQYGDEQAGWDPDVYQLLGVEEVYKAKDLHRDLGGFATKADDALVRMADNRLIISERKTASNRPRGSDEDIQATLKAQGQLAALAYCARDHYGEIPLIVHDRIVKLKNPEFYRIEVEFTDEDLDRWEAEQKELEQMVPLTCANRDNCDPPVGYRCEYFHYCHGTNDQREKLYEIRHRS